MHFVMHNVIRIAAGDCRRKRRHSGEHLKYLVRTHPPSTTLMKCTKMPINAMTCVR
jgi:hypothetical protein